MEREPKISMDINDVKSILSDVNGNSWRQYTKPYMNDNNWKKFRKSWYDHLRILNYPKWNKWLDEFKDEFESEVV